MQDPKSLIPALQFLKLQSPSKPNRLLTRIVGGGVLALMLAAASSTPTFAKSVPVQALKSQSTVAQETAAQASDAIGEGVVIVAVDPEGPAAQAGVVRGDILLTVGGVAVDSMAALYAVVVDAKPGDVVDVVVLHGDEARTLAVTLAQVNERTYLGVQVVDALGTVVAGSAAAVAASPVVADEEVTIVRIEPAQVASPTASSAGVVVVQRDANTTVYMLSSELLVAEVMAGSPAAVAGLAVGDLITAVDGQPVASMDELQQVLASLTPGQEIRLSVYRAIYRATPTAGVSDEVVVTLGAAPDNAEQAYLGVRIAEGENRVSVAAAPVMEFAPVSPAQVYAVPSVPTVTNHCEPVLVSQYRAFPSSALPAPVFVSPQMDAQPVTPSVPFFIHGTVQDDVYQQTITAAPSRVYSTVTMQKVGDHTVAVSRGNEMAEVVIYEMTTVAGVDEPTVISRRGEAMRVYTYPATPTASAVDVTALAAPIVPSSITASAVAVSPTSLPAYDSVGVINGQVFTWIAPNVMEVQALPATSVPSMPNVPSVSPEISVDEWF